MNMVNEPNCYENWRNHEMIRVKVVTSKSSKLAMNINWHNIKQSFIAQWIYFNWIVMVECNLKEFISQKQYTFINQLRREE
jgi:uncharacterized membrane protein YcgQ (UPF0703/DUF1980 family)